MLYPGRGTGRGKTACYALGQGVSMGGLGIANPTFNYAVQRNHAARIVWDCGHGLMNPLSYVEAPVRAQDKNVTHG